MIKGKIMSELWVPTKQQILPCADLSGADLQGADLWGGMSLNTPSGAGYLIPTPAGWKITIGSWANKTLEDLRAIVEGDDWPESVGVERERLRPIMAGVLALRLLLEGKK
jgi:hypothetical protein